MKKALKINLSGQIFHIDEDAYDTLKIYLDRISSHFIDARESKEIITDIESRIAELFTEKLRDGSQVITISLVEQIIEIMGRPEEIASEEEPVQESGSGRRSHRRLYRDTDNSVIGGVSSGLGAYFNVDTLIIRILFIVLTIMGFGFPVLLYLILWIAVPKARTAAEKLEMRGEKVNVSNIEKTVREEYENVKENLKKARNSDTYKRTEGFLEEFFRVVGSILVALVKIVLVVIGIAFVAAGLGILIGFVAMLFFGVHFLPFEAYHSMKLDFLSPFISPGNLSLLAISITMLIAIPVLSVVYALFKSIFRFKANNRALGMSAFALWVLALVAAISMVVFEAREFSYEESVSSTRVLSSVDERKLMVSVDNVPAGLTRVHGESFRINGSNYYLTGEGTIFGRAKVDIEKSESGHFEIRLTKGAKGLDERTAGHHAESVIYSYSVKDNHLLLAPFFSIPDETRWRMQYTEVTIFVPEGDTIVLDQSLREYMERARNMEGYSGWRMAGNTWVMGSRGLELAGEE